MNEIVFLPAIDSTGQRCLAGFLPEEIKANPRIETDVAYRQKVVALNETRFKHKRAVLVLPVEH
jgi:hypothetical protein